MKADLSRSTFAPQKHFHDVRLQQGRVQLDADWNEQVDIAAHRVETETLDVVGKCGAPVHDAAFAIATTVAALPTAQQAAATALGALAKGDFFLSAGRYYAQGILCENEAPVKYSAQPDLPTAPLSASGLYLAYLDVWPRHLTFLDDPALREVALNGPDTATRVKTVWQVKLAKVGATGATADCNADYPAYDTATAAPTGKLAARAEPGATSDLPCIIEPGAGYRSLENQLYRVEIHRAGTNGVATFKWSRDNGAVSGKWIQTGAANIIQLSRPPPDDKLGFAVGQWVEISDDTNDLNGTAGMLVQLTKVESQFLTLSAPPVALTNFKLNPKVRRWDSMNSGDTAGDIPVAANKWLDLENGVQVEFAAGTFRTGDYWLIPARTATANVEWPTDTAANPLSILPQGIPHSYCRLGFVDFNGTTIVETDCRPLFPPLTEIQPGGDLKLHNKHLHGWGVVCGLQVHCGGERAQVLVESGHAIACDGTDILLNAPQTLPAVAQARQLGLLDDAGTGDVMVRLTADDNDKPVLAIVAPPPDSTKNLLEQILEGTLWMDFFNSCLQPYIKYFQKEFSASANDTKLVPDSKRMQIAAINLGYQLVNSTAGERVWLSAAEHALLARAYGDLNNIVTSDTYCALKDNLTPFPAYPFGQLNAFTAFGKSFMSGARITPDGTTVVAFEGVNKGTFSLFDLATGEMTSELTIVGPEPLTVRDAIAFGDKASQLLVTAVGTNVTTMAVFDLNSKQQVGAVFNFYSVDVVRLELSPFDTSTVFALAVNRGIFSFQPANLNANTFGQPIIPFPAVGQLALNENVLAATVTAQGGGTNYGAILVGRLDPAGNGLSTINLATADGLACTGSDSIAIVNVPGTELSLPTIYVVVGPRAGQTNKRILGFVGARPASVVEIPLNTTGPVRLGVSGRYLLIALAEECQVLCMDSTKNVVDDSNVLPGQITPAGFATPMLQSYRFQPNHEFNWFNAGNDNAFTYPVVVVNALSQTLTVFPASLVGLSQPLFTYAALSTYRDAMIAAFRDLISRIGQALKDCLCDRLLLDCPECGPDDVIYLARVEIRQSRVYHICNFVRRDVLTFPKVKYWLSAVPVLPLLKFAVEKFCCSVLPDMMQGKTFGGNFINGSMASAFASKIQTQGFKINVADYATRFGTMGKFAAHSFAARAFFNPVESASVAAPATDIIDASPSSATTALSDQGVQVASVQDYNSLVLNNGPIFQAENVPLKFDVGDRVRLFTQNGRVVFYQKINPDVVAAVGGASDVPAPAAANATDADNFRFRQDVTTMRSQIVALQKAHSTALASRDEQIAELRATTAALHVSMAALQKNAPAPKPPARATAPRKPAATKATKKPVRKKR